MRAYLESRVTPLPLLPSIPVPSNFRHFRGPSYTLHGMKSAGTKSYNEQSYMLSLIPGLMLHGYTVMILDYLTQCLSLKLMILLSFSRECSRSIALPPLHQQGHSFRAH
jgi:hypothetical protein